MGIFDNVTSITIDDKAVKSITIDGGVIYEKDEPTPVPTFTSMIVVNHSYSEPVVGAEVTVDSSSDLKGVTDENGRCTFDLSEGSHTVDVIAEGFEDNSSTIEVGGSGTSHVFTITLTESQVTTQ